MSANKLPHDSVREAGFPTVTQFRRGVLLDCICHSFWFLRHEAVFHRWWEGNTYHVDDIQGEHWAVTFADGGVVAAFYSSESSRNPFPADSPPYDQSWFFRGMPERLLPVKEQTLRSMYDFDFAFNNPTEAAITAAMWADGERFTAVEPWADVYDHSLWVLHHYLLPAEEAMAEWWQGMGYECAGRAAVWSLFDRRVMSKEAVIPVLPHEIQGMRDVGGDSLRPGGFFSAAELLAGVGIHLDADAV